MLLYTLSTAAALLLGCLPASHATWTCPTHDGKVITISKMKLYTLCGASDGYVDVVFKMESDTDWEVWGLPASIEATASVSAVTLADEWVAVDQQFILWPPM